MKPNGNDKIIANENLVGNRRCYWDKEGNLVGKAFRMWERIGERIRKALMCSVKDLCIYKATTKLLVLQVYKMMKEEDRKQRHKYNMNTRYKILCTNTGVDSQCNLL